MAAADAEEPRGSLDHVDVHDDLGLVRAGLRRDRHALEKAQVDELLPGPLPFLQRVEVPFAQRELAAQDLVLAPHVAADIDPLDVHLRPFRNFEGQVDLVGRSQLIALRIHVGRGAADRAVEIQNPLDTVADLHHRKDVAGLEFDLPEDLALRQERHARDLHRPDRELGTLQDDDRDRHARPLAIDCGVGRFHPSLDVAVVVVRGDDTVDVRVEALALYLAAQDEVLPFLRLHRVFKLVVRQSLVPAEHDCVDGHLAPLDDAEDQAHITVAELLDVRGDLNLEVSLVLVVVAELLHGALYVDGVVDATQFDVDLLLQRLPVRLLVTDEVDVAHERTLGHHEHDLHSALEVFDSQLDVVEEPEAEDGADVLGEEGRVERRADGALDAAEDHGVVDSPAALDLDVLDDDGGGLGRLRPRRRGGEKACREDDDNGETHSSRG